MPHSAIQVYFGIAKIIILAYGNVFEPKDFIKKKVKGNTTHLAPALLPMFSSTKY
jgi:hypothetical protein